LAEGPQAIREALAGGYVERLLATVAAAERYPDLVTGGWWQVDERVLAELADTVHPSGLLALCRWEAGDLGAVVATDPRLVVVGAAIRDPGNAGTVIRCADAFGAAAVVLAGDSVDATNAKTVRASAGSVFHLPVVTADLAAAVASLRAAGLKILAADGQGDADLAELAAAGELNTPVGWLFGNEAWGLPDTALALADQVVRVPMWGRAESLNLATAAAVCLYATASAQAADPTRFGTKSR
jgi:TrmH family RNA methyltransferase